MHLAACRVNRLKALKKPEIVEDRTTIDCQISKANKPLYGKIGGYMISVFNDAKRGTLSAWSWPSRQVAFMRADHFNCNRTMQNFSMSNEDFRYLSPTSHAELLDFIVKADLKGMGEVLTNSLAVSLRTDGAVDRMQIHNNHLGAKVIHQDGSDSTFFLGFGESQNGGAKGYLEAIMEACRPLSWESLFGKTSSLVTDGENMNTGSRNGLWALADRYRRDSSSDLPLIKIWCAAHRINLAWKSVTKEVQEVDRLIKDASSLSTYFRMSAVRTKNLKNIAEQNELQYFHYPRYFEVRWTQFCHELLESALKNWKASIKYFENEQGQEARGFLNKWLDKDNIHLASITADVLYIYKRFHQAFQDDNILIFDIIKKKESVLRRFEELKHTPLVGGWEELFLTKLKLLDGQYEFLGNKLNVKDRRGSHNIYVSDKRTIDAVRNEVIQSVVNFLNDRLDDDSLESTAALSPLNKLDPSATNDQLKACHNAICPDLSLLDFASEYRDAADIEDLRKLNTQSLLRALASEKKCSTLTTAIARVVAAKPHSADVERLVSTYNKLKTSDRAWLSSETIRNYLHVSENMGDLESFDPSQAALDWLTSKNRRAKYPEKAKQQGWFIGVFTEAEDYRQKKKAEISQKPNRVKF